MKYVFLCAAALLLFNSCERRNAASTHSFTMQPSVFSAKDLAAPHPEKKPKILTAPNGEQRTDEYYWLNERENPAVTAYLEAENKYAETVMAPVAALRDRLFEELKSRIKEDDNSVPYFNRGYWYYTRFETGKEYPVFCRKKETLEAPEEILIDVNQLAAGKPYCNVSGLNVSPDNRLLFYAVDYSGRNLYKSRIKDLSTGRLLPEEMDSAFGASVWSKDSKYLFYDTKDPVTLRTDKIWRHEVGADAQKDALVFHETDETTYASLSGSKDGAYAFINHGYTQNVETHFLSMDRPLDAFQVIAPRQKDSYYEVEHHNGRFIIRTNLEGRNFSVMSAPVDQPGKSNWTPLLPYRADALVESIDVFRDFMAINERRGGLQRIRVYQWADGATHDIDFGEPTYDASSSYLPNFDAKEIRYVFSSLKTPSSVFDYEVATRTKVLKKTEPVLGGYDPAQYATEFLWAPARDGMKVPVSVVYKKGTPRDGSAPCYQIGYGSYGSSYDPGFNKNLISLLDRGFVCAIAHIRGGMEMGFEWYEQGKMLHKMNTFYDFIDCSEMLIREKYTAADRLFAQGGSAGGLLMGAVVNLRPDLYKGVIASVPFVDVLTTMSDPSIPLTTGEYTEWGNPAHAAEYSYMKQYSPYDNVKAQAYPNMLVKTSFSDSQVQYFEPAKWVARLRDLKTDDHLLLFVTNMTGSHGGSSGRFERLKERAMEYAWMLGLLGQR